ncbi:hypothetical protein ACQQCD_12230 [Pseudarthrobacter sp. J1763]|uniref:hypothetical protein n=1 Tax=Pseudarthrobacter sp. J1763 TaxID=3420445 RepID=UPI003D2C8024
MTDVTAILNLTFFGTLGVALLLLLGIALFGFLAMVVVGLGRGLYSVATLGKRRRMHRDESFTEPAEAPDAGEAAPSTLWVEEEPPRLHMPAISLPKALKLPARKPKEPKEPRALKPASEKPQLNPRWSKAVWEADARALAKAVDSGVIPRLARVENPRAKLGPEPTDAIQKIVKGTGTAAAKNISALETGSRVSIADSLPTLPNRANKPGIARRAVAGYVTPAAEQDSKP